MAENTDDKSVISLAIRTAQELVGNLSEMADAGKKLLRDTQRTNSIADEAIEAIRENDALAPLERTQNIEHIQDQFRRQAANRMAHVFLKSLGRELVAFAAEGKKIEDIDLSKIATDKLQAVLALAFGNFSTWDNGKTFRKNFSSEKKAKLAQRVLQETYVCASWDLADNANVDKIKISHKNGKFQLSMPRDVMGIIFQNEDAYIGKPERQR